MQTDLPVRRSSAIAAILLGLLLAMPAFADPPSHAPAHGWRKKNDPHYVGYTGHEWPRDYGIVEGNCNRKEIGTVLGAVAGAAVGSQIGDGSGRNVAIIVGGVLGAVIGREIGRDLDEGDRGCVGHSLELVRDGQSVRWLNDSTGVSYLLTPTSGKKKNGQSCRKFRLKTTRNGKSGTTDGNACRAGDGTWKMM